MKKIFALSFSLIMFSAFASVNTDYGGDSKKHNTDVEITKTIPVVADNYQAVDFKVVSFINETETETGSEAAQTTINTSEKIFRLSSIAPSTQLFRRTDYEYSCSPVKGN